ncbi:TonB-dependent receptor [Algicola sagamiensis]|uniref:TonB-dependent receptor n=1 Tax=Algicola sagamiensis TaxID=163869 RepID=UPI0003652C88|nr:TonB-dependent receptor [Algicola sagamiensis]
MNTLRIKTICIVFTCSVEAVHAHDYSFETFTVIGRQTNLIGEAVNASEGLVGQEELGTRALMRVGEVMELVPGMVATQHSGSGKANQYFLRGFNLDHGVDFATYIDGMPVNMRTHGHGQGYSDMNFLIPEMIDYMSYQKGPYFAEVGDFSSAGSAAIKTKISVDNQLVGVSAGQNDYRRGLFIGSTPFDDGTLLAAVEIQYYDGPWKDVEEDVNKQNIQLKWTKDFDESRLSLNMMSYQNEWNSADQIPARAVRQGLIDELGSIDPTLGGETSRFSLSGSFETPHITAQAYLIEYQMRLWSNFTYFLDDPQKGDQFEQEDNRYIYGGKFKLAEDFILFETLMANTLGIEVRSDQIKDIGLYQAQRRQRLGVIRRDRVEQSSYSLFAQNEAMWTDELSTVLSIRYDFHEFEVRPREVNNQFGVALTQNQGEKEDDIISLKGSLRYQWSEAWEAYVSAGQGYHSNDARGTTIQVDPRTGQSSQSVNPLVRSQGAETGFRWFIEETVNASLSLWYLELDSELLFVGDSGGTEASRASKRRGVELTTYYTINQNWSFDLEYANTHARYQSSTAGESDHIPGTVDEVIQFGFTGNSGTGWYGSSRFRYYSGRPLNESGSVRSDSSSILNLNIGFLYQDYDISLAVFNALDSQDHDIDYLYESQLVTESAPMEDLHYHILEPRTIRIKFLGKF